MSGGAILQRHRGARLALDALGVGLLATLVGGALFSLVQDLEYWGPSGLVLGRLFNRNDGGGIHTLAILGIVLPMVLWGRKLRINWIFIAVAAFIADYYHEGLWNIPYYLHYWRDLDQVYYYAAMSFACFLFFGTIVYKGKGHNFRHFLYLLPWFALITAYLLFVGHYSEDLFGPQAYYTNVWVNAYEIFEVNLFAWLLYLGGTRKSGGLEPVMRTTYGTQPDLSEMPTSPSRPPGPLSLIARALFGSPAFWLILILLFVGVALWVNAPLLGVVRP